MFPGAVWRAAFAPDEGHKPSGSSGPPGLSGPPDPSEPPDPNGPYAQGDPGGPFPPEVLQALPPGFTGRIVARSGERTGGVVWHAAPDGGGCFPDGDGWIYVSNCSLPLLGGVTALRFAPDGTLRDGCRVLSGADCSGAGAATPWNTWLSGERTPYGQVFECDPYGLRAPMPRLAMGLFSHGGVACDPDRGVVYLTEREPDGCLYRFRPDDWGDLTTGVLEVMTGAPGEEEVGWERVPAPAGAQVVFGEHAPIAGHMPLRDQVKAARRFTAGGECHCRDGLLWFVTEGDGRVWAYDVVHERLTVAHDAADRPGDPAGGEQGGQQGAGQDGGRRSEQNGGQGGGQGGEITLVAADRMVPFLRVTGGWTVSGPAMSPAGDRLYFSCRPPRSAGPAPVSVTVEVCGPFLDLVRG
ncbi:alkaline phosphatase PhoX [Microbispora sp. H11081]|uniref:alkaline phosphatase PhoX n=1 Tax=Microbispora sp. H11081 TaxID=2729107 RepID=UPI00289DF871|nr:alkaline phosphatase PhoX [Microbispora sp. H11081]